MIFSVQREVGFKSTMKELDIGEVVRLSGIMPSTLRFYEKKGLIKPLGRNGLRRLYHQNVLKTLQLIALGQAAGFTLEQMRTMLTPQGHVTLNHDTLLQRGAEMDETITRLQQLSQGLKHVARCTAQTQTECDEFQKVVARGRRLIR